MYINKRELTIPAALGKEWISTNGLGGYASSTVCDVHTRRYHGWLMAATEPPSGRTLCFSRFMETLHLGQTSAEISSAEYPGVIWPKGFDKIVAFWDDPVPSFMFAVEGTQLLRQVYLLSEKNVCVIVYSVLDSRDTPKLLLTPLVNWRHYHHLTHAPVAGWNLSSQGSVTRLESPSGRELLIASSDGEFLPRPLWYHQTLYREESARGLDSIEEHWSPGVLEIDFATSHHNRVVIAVGLEDEMTDVTPDQIEPPPQSPHGAASTFAGILERAARTFIVKRGIGKSIIAGYHWFSDWGRDTMISLPGLLLVTGHTKDALSVIETWAETRHEGLIPNRFDDHGSSPEWNSVDAPLWFVYAVYKYWKYTQDRPTVRRLLGIIEDMVESYIRGTLFGIAMDRSGLLRAGQHGLQLTWMDAKVHDQVITQRAGYAVDVNALWHNALCCLAGLESAAGNRAKSAYYEALAQQTAKAFGDMFWNGRCLNDTFPDGTEVRPNQLLAASLPFSPLPPERLCAVVEIARQELLTPFGLRTLTPSHPSYRGRYEGGVEQRDRAYHQGTCWPWLIGPYISASRRAGKQPEDLWHLVLPFEGHLREAGIASVSEIFDGDFPFHPRGCVSQAWSVAEILRALKEDILGEGPS